MTEAAAATRSLVVERELPHPPEKVRRALTEGPLIEAWLIDEKCRPSGRSPTDARGMRRCRGRAGSATVREKPRPSEAHRRKEYAP